ncbi:hypothetical protein VCHENC02_1808A, partial [Vibrio harveyi]|jgi:hypothetical protein
MKKG